jgi:hypothetical protein
VEAFTLPSMYEPRKHKKANEGTNRVSVLEVHEFSTTGTEKMWCLASVSHQDTVEPPNGLGRHQKLIIKTIQ